MRSPHAVQFAEWLMGPFHGSTGASGRIVLTHTVAGGVGAGGLLLGSLALAGRVNPGLQLLMVPVLFLVGTLLGFAHGVALAIAGRSVGCTGRCACSVVLHALPLTLAAILAAWVATAGISLTATLRTDWHPAWAVTCAAASLVGLAAFVWAVLEGVRAVARAYHRCPHRVAGLGVVALAFAGLLIGLLHLPSEVPGAAAASRMSFAIPLALAATAWIVVPVMYVSLQHLFGNASERACAPTPP